MAVRQSGETESDVSIMASCESWALFPGLSLQVAGRVSADRNRRSVPSGGRCAGELLLSAVLMPFVSPNIFATLAFFSALSVVCHCCLNEKWVMLFSIILNWLRAVVAWETRLA